MKNDDKRFKNFTQLKILLIFHEAFTTEQHSKIHKWNLFSLLKIIWDLKNHSYRAEFEQTQRIHLESYHQIQSFYEADWKHAKEQQILYYI